MNQPDLTFVVFSKDRPLQLHGLLCSLARHCQEPVDVFVLYAASSQAQYQRYREVFEEVRPLVVHPVLELYSFADHVKTVVSWVRTPLLAFLVDDIVFIRDFKPSALLRPVMSGAIASLRLGPKISFSYMTNREMTRPALAPRGGFLWWRWNQGNLDWCYPMSVDGNVFRTKVLVRLVGRLAYRSPNSLEAILNDEAPPYRKRRALCFPQPVLVNIPANKVQSDLPGNRSGAVSVEELARLWDDGCRMDVAKYDELQTNSVHFETELFLTREKGGI